jgi:HEAT repeat protein
MPMDDEATESAVKDSKKVRWYQLKVTHLIVLVICVGALLWSARDLWLRSSPLTRDLRMLASSDPSDRIEGARGLAQTREADNSLILEALLPLMTDPDRRVRLTAAESVGDLVRLPQGAPPRDPKLVRGYLGALSRSLKDKDFELRCTVAIALAPFLRANASPTRNAANADEASAVDAKSIANAMVEVLSKNPTPVERFLAVRCFRTVATPQLGPPPEVLMAARKDPSSSVRMVAWRALSDYGISFDPFVGELFDELRSDEQALRETAYVLIRRADLAIVIPAAVEALKSPHRTVRYETARLLGEMGKQASSTTPQLLVVFAEKPTDPYRTDPASEAVRALGTVAPGSPFASSVISALIADISSGRKDRQHEVLASLRKFGAAAADTTPALIEATKKARSGADTPLVEALLWTISILAPKSPYVDEAFATVKESLTANDYAVRLAAVEAVAHFDTKVAEALPLVRKLEDDPNPNVRTHASEMVHMMETGQKPTTPP